MPEAEYWVALLRASPYGSTKAWEALDTLMAFAAFEQPIKPIFMGDGVWQLVDSVAPADPSHKQLHKVIASLPLFDVDEWYACESSLTARSLATTRLIGGTTVCNSAGLRAICCGARGVLSF